MRDLSWKSPRLGPVQKKVVLLLWAGVGLAFAATPRQSNRILLGVCDEWQKINRDSLRRALLSLEASRVVERKKQRDGSYEMTLTTQGKGYVERNLFAGISFAKPDTWNGKWHIILYDVPEELRGFRIALNHALQRLGCYELQRSVFVFPYDCEKQVKRIMREYKAYGYIRYMVAEYVDDEKALLRHFKLTR